MTECQFMRFMDDMFYKQVYEIRNDNGRILPEHLRRAIRKGYIKKTEI